MQAQISAQSKSGIDSIHGTAYAYFRNNALNASDLVEKYVLPYSDQQYGGTVGGPIFKDKLWYFGSYEGERTPQTYVSTPTYFPGQTFTNFNYEAELYDRASRLPALEHRSFFLPCCWVQLL